jgi:hypothetical protein
MSSRQKYRKLNLGPSEKITARNSVVGMLCISDYIDTQVNSRVLVFERPSKIVSVDAKAPTPRKKRQAVNGSEQPEGGLAFPGTGTAGA